MYHANADVAPGPVSLVQEPYASLTLRQASRQLTYASISLSTSRFWLSRFIAHLLLLVVSFGFQRVVTLGAGTGRGEERRAAAGPGGAGGGRLTTRSLRRRSHRYPSSKACRGSGYLRE